MAGERILRAIALGCVLASLVAGGRARAAPEPGTSAGRTSEGDPSSGEPATAESATPESTTGAPLAVGDVVHLSDLDPEMPWRIVKFDIEGVNFIRAWLLESGLATKTRTWWAFWREQKEFEPAYLADDLKRMDDQLAADGYYDAKVTHQIEVVRLPERRADVPEHAPDLDPKAAYEPGEVAVRVEVDLGDPTLVCAMSINFGETPPAASDEAELRRRLPLAVGGIFAQDDYQQNATMIADVFSEHGYPDAKVDRKARVDAVSRCADVSYRLVPGEQAVFGKTSVDGLDGLRDELATRELAYRPGELYDSRLVRETERRLRGLKIFSIARVDPGAVDAEGQVPIAIRLAPGPTHEVRLGVGYSSEEGVRGLASWWDYNLFGGGEQLGASARISQISRLVSASYVQPHFPGLDNRSAITVNVGQDDESTYLNNFTRGVPQIDWRLGTHLNATTFFRGEYDSLSGVSDSTKDALKVFQSSGFTTTLGTSLRWTRVDDALDPRRGIAAGIASEIAGGPVLGADFSWFRLIANARAYYPIYGDLVAAARITAGSIGPYDGTPQIPLWERFYAGGSGIYPVRGYGRRRIGPITGSNDPLGGRSMTIGSLEARHPIWGPVTGVAFVDTGDIELSSWTLSPSDFQTGVGFGLRANSPVGPIEIDLGFGLDRPKGDSLVQVSFSIGPEF